jgi:hypothetical protein
MMFSSIGEGELMVMPNWETDDEGLVILHPIVAYETALLAQTGCGLRLEFVDRPEDIGRSSRFLTFAMLPKQARELAADLLAMADKAVQRPQGTVPN